MKFFFETWKNFSFKVSDCLMFEWPALCNGIMLGKKFRDFFSILVTFFAVCKQLWAILVKRLVIAKLGWKNYIPQPKHLEKNLKFSKIFFLNLFLRQVVIFSKLQLPSLWIARGLSATFFQIWSFLILLGDFRQSVSEFFQIKQTFYADLGLRHCIAERFKAKSWKFFKFENFLWDLEGLNFSFKVSEKLFDIWMTSSLQWHHAWKKILGLFSILVTFFAVCKQLWAILVKRLVIAKLGWKNYIPQPNTSKKF